MKWINYHHLIYFKEIATHGTVSAASRVLKVGQPALSAQLKAFEDSLQVQLFERKKGRLKLTDAGKVALEYANKINSLGQEFLQVIENNGFEDNLHLTLGALDGVPKQLIGDIIDTLHKEMKCTLSVYEDSIPRLLKDLAEHRIDLVITDHEAAPSQRKSILKKEISEVPIHAYASPRFEHLREDFPHSLSGVPIILPTAHSQLRFEIEHFFSNRGIAPHVLAETQDTSLQKILACKGDGVAFLPHFAAKEFLDAGQLVKLGSLRSVSVTYYLVTQERVVDNPALKFLMKNFVGKKLR